MTVTQLFFDMDQYLLHVHMGYKGQEPHWCWLKTYYDYHKFKMAAKLGKPQVSNVPYVTDIAYILTDLSKVPQQ